MRIDEPTLIDTNLLIFACDKSSLHFKAAVALRDLILDSNVNAYITPQILYEFYAVITNPKRVAAPLSPNLALKEVKNYISTPQFKKVYPIKEKTLEKVFELVGQNKLTRTDIFDAHIAAVMLENGIPQIFTDNEKDFARFKKIKVYNPLKNLHILA